MWEAFYNLNIEMTYENTFTHIAWKLKHMQENVGGINFAWIEYIKH